MVPISAAADPAHFLNCGCLVPSPIGPLKPEDRRAAGGRSVHALIYALLYESGIRLMTFSRSVLSASNPAGIPATASAGGAER